jgi:serine/threonine protein kinase
VSAGEIGTFGNYQLLEKIATGGMAEVFRARARGAMGFEKILVIKRILDTLAKDEEFQELFKVEARIAAMLVHPNIVQVFELGRQDESLFIAMEYVHGVDLARVVTRAKALGDVPIDLALFLTGEVLKALQFAHASVHPDTGRPLDVVHCDISPQNILVSFAGEVKITDFGISRAAIQQGNQEVIRGKYAYMSPEQVEGKVLDGRSDLFSLGIVLYELLTGRRLFKSRTRDETLARVRRAEVPSPRAWRPSISDELEQFLLRTLARNADDRWSDAAEMLDALARITLHERHRAGSADLAAWVRSVIDASNQTGDVPKAPKERAHAPSEVVVLAVEASPLPKSVGTPMSSLPALGKEWDVIVAEEGGDIWERGDGNLLLVWSGAPIAEMVRRAVSTAVRLQRVTMPSGFQLSAGVAPGMARIGLETRRPPDGWELAGPFYLARWMMNLSAHRGRLVLTDVGARSLEDPTTLVGRIPIQGSRFISLYELGG